MINAIGTGTLSGGAGTLFRAPALYQDAVALFGFIGTPRSSPVKHLREETGPPPGRRSHHFRGRGGFQRRWPSRPRRVQPVQPSVVAVADLNGDGFPDLAVANAGSNDVSILLNDGAWPGPAPPPGGGTQGRVLERRTSPAPVAVAVADLVRHDPGVPASAPPPATVPPGGEVKQPLLNSDAAKGNTRAACAAFPGPQPPSPVLARAERTARSWTDWFFAAEQQGWLCDCSAGALSLP